LPLPSPDVEQERSDGTDDPERVAGGLAPHLSAAERRAIELRAMEVVEGHLRGRCYRDITDVSRSNPYDLGLARTEKARPDEGVGTGPRTESLAANPSCFAQPKQRHRRCDRYWP